MESWSTVVDLITKYGNIIKICRFLSHPHIGVRSTERASMSEIDVVFGIYLLIFSMCRASLSRCSSRWSECRHRGYSSRPPLVASSRTSRICIVIILLASGGRRSASRWISSSLLRSPVASGRRWNGVHRVWSSNKSRRGFMLIYWLVLVDLGALTPGYDVDHEKKNVGM